MQAHYAIEGIAQKRTERVLVVDDDPSVRALLSIILERDHHVVVGVASSGCEAIRKVATAAPSLMLLDLDMPRMEGLSTLRKLRQHYPWLPVLVFSMLDPEVYALRCARLGARGFLAKGEGVALLPEILGQMRRGLMLFPRQVAEGVMPCSSLADRELVALRCLVRGGDMDTIAAALAVSRDVVSVLRRRLLAKLELSSDEELISFSRPLRLC